MHKQSLTKMRSSLVSIKNSCRKALFRCNHASERLPKRKVYRYLMASSVLILSIIGITNLNSFDMLFETVNPYNQIVQERRLEVYGTTDQNKLTRSRYVTTPSPTTEKGGSDNATPTANSLTEEQRTAKEALHKLGLTNLESYVFDKRFKLYRKKIIKSPFKDKKQYHNSLGISKKIKIAKMCKLFYGPVFKTTARAFGVTENYMAAIMSVESSCGKALGSYKLFNAIVSNYLFDRRKLLWETQLKCLSWMADKGYDVYVRSSKQGAMGIPQFLPCSLKNKGFDLNYDGRVNLFDINEASASMALFLSSAAELHIPDKKLFLSNYDYNMEAALYTYNPSSWYVEAIQKIVEALRDAEK
ncbi:MAG: hypothetical protein D6769_00040 [Methanobacteriota archaeon]|nr:MAG: hypothetical protein D6769_00040 [Euryarchaeota archaeon]